MHLLEAGMAFAVVMIIFATITTGVVEFVTRILGWRSKFLQDAVTELFNQVIWPRLKSHFPETKEERQRILDDYLTRLLENPAGGKSNASMFSKDKRISVLSIVAFSERLGRTEIGQKILAEGEDQLQLLVKDFVRSFNRFSLAASEVYRRNTQVVAIVVGILVALAANVDILRVSSAILEDPDLRRGLIEQADSANKENAAALKALEDAKATLDKGAGDPNVAMDIDAAIKSLDEYGKKVDELEEIGLPVGPSYFPHCHVFATAQENTDGCDVWQNADWRKLLFQWFPMTVIAGILIGLGGPFWFRVFTGLSHLAQLLRSLGISSSRPGVKPEEVTPTDKVEESSKPDDIVDAFETAAKVHAQQGALTNGRAILNENGTPVAGGQS